MQAVIARVEQKGLTVAGAVSLVAADVRVGPDDTAQMAVDG
nr:hypothetical protein [Pseudomonas syringae group genomosp. 3]